MRPYITVIIDSFNEALASRVLWILLFLSTLVLLAIAPLGIQEQRAVQLRQHGVSNWPGLIVHIKEESKSSTPSPGKQIWKLSSDRFKKTINSAIRGEGPPEISRQGVSILLEEFNELLTERSFYEPTAWSDRWLGGEASQMLKEGVETLSDEDIIVLNRLLLKSAYQMEIASTPSEEIYISYLTWSIGEPLPVSRSMLMVVIKGILAQVMAFFVGTVAVFVAILVTAPIIPRTFEAGAIDLLLSKPISRSLLFLAKFLGGCAFILLNASYFIVGLWLVMGFRLGLWSHNLLLCIPIFLFMFIIYYSVSTLAAVYWKNSIVSIVVTILFWAACFGVGLTKNVIEAIFLDPYRIVKIVPTSDSLAGINRTGKFVEWQEDQKKWEQILQGDPRQRGPDFAQRASIIGPVFDTTRSQLMFIQQPQRRGRFSFGNTRGKLTTAARSGTWQRNEGPTLPQGTAWLFLDAQNEITVVAPAGPFRLNKELKNDKNIVESFLGFSLPFGGGDPFVAVGPEPAVGFEGSFSAAMDPTTGDLAVFNNDTLTYLVRGEHGKYELGPIRKFVEKQGPASLAFTGETILICFSDGQILLLDSENLKTRQEYQPAGESEPYMSSVSADGRWFSVLFHNGKLWLRDTDKNITKEFGNDISAVAFAGDQQLLVVDRGTRATRYELGSFQVVERMQPKLEILEKVYHYFIYPIYTIFPKPGELSNLVDYLLTEQETKSLGPPGEADLREARIKLNIYGPIWSSLAFVVVILSITCLYIRRADM